MLLLAMVNRRLKVMDAFLDVRIGLFGFRRLGVFQSFLGMGDKNVGVAGLAMLNGFFGVGDGFREMAFRQRQTRHGESGDSQTGGENEGLMVHYKLLFAARRPDGVHYMGTSAAG
jgi:hypothetical protein